MRVEHRGLLHRLTLGRVTTHAVQFAEQKLSAVSVGRKALEARNNWMGGHSAAQRTALPNVRAASRTGNFMETLDG